MDRDKAVQEIQDGLGFKQNRPELAINALKQAQDSLERGRSLPWFLIQEDQVLSMTARRPWVLLPNRFLREVGESIRFVDTVSGLGTVYPVRVDYNTSLPSGSSFPSVYTVRANKLYIYPAPDTDTDLLWEFYQGEPNLNQNVENNWLLYFPYLLIALAGQICAGKRRDPDAMKVFMAQEAKEMPRYLAAITDREESGIMRVMGGRD